MSAENIYLWLMNQDESDIDEKDVLVVVAVVMGLGILGFAAAVGVVWGVMKIFGWI